MKNVRPKKHLGQHFLNDTKTAIEITKLLNKNTEYVVEIGPGMGMLTQFLIKNNYTTEVVEIDQESVIYLKSSFPKLKIYHADFLNLNIKEILPPVFSIIGNFPYNISSQILFKVFEYRDQVPELIGMFQKEVAERVACKRGKKRGLLSVLIQTFYSIEYCFTVSPDQFTPPPKVQSAVIKLIRNKRKEINVDEKKFMTVIKSGFNQKRKTLRNSLKAFTLINQEEITDLLTLRPEQLSVDDFIRLTRHVK